MVFENYILEKDGKFIIQRELKGKTHKFGSFNTFQEAKIECERLDDNGWPIPIIKPFDYDFYHPPQINSAEISNKTKFYQHKLLKISVESLKSRKFYIQLTYHENLYNIGYFESEDIAKEVIKNFLINGSITKETLINIFNYDTFEEFKNNTNLLIFYSDDLDKWILQRNDINNNYLTLGYYNNQKLAKNKENTYLKFQNIISCCNKLEKGEFFHFYYESYNYYDNIQLEYNNIIKSNKYILKLNFQELRDFINDFYEKHYSINQLARDYLFSKDIAKKIINTYELGKFNKIIQENQNNIFIPLPPTMNLIKKINYKPKIAFEDENLEIYHSINLKDNIWIRGGTTSIIDAYLLNELYFEFKNGKTVLELSEKYNINKNRLKKIFFNYESGRFDKVMQEWEENGRQKPKPKIEPKKEKKLIAFEDENIENYRKINLKDNILIRAFTSHILFAYELETLYQEFNEGKTVQQLSEKYAKNVRIIKKIIFNYESGRFDKVMQEWEENGRQKPKPKIEPKKNTKPIAFKDENLEIYHKINLKDNIMIRGGTTSIIDAYLLNELYFEFKNGKTVQELSEKYNINEYRIKKLIFNYDLGRFNNVLQEWEENGRQKPKTHTEPKENTEPIAFKDENLELYHDINLKDNILIRTGTRGILYAYLIEEIYQEYKQKQTIKQISEKHYINEKTIKRIIFNYEIGKFDKALQEWTENGSIIPLGKNSSNIESEILNKKEYDNFEVYIHKFTDSLWVPKFRKNNNLQVIEYCTSETEAREEINKFLMDKNLEIPPKINITEERPIINKSNTNEKIKKNILSKFNITEKTPIINKEIKKEIPNKNLEIKVFVEETDGIFKAKSIENNKTKILGYSLSLERAEKHAKNYLKENNLPIPEKIRLINKNQDSQISKKINQTENQDIKRVSEKIPYEESKIKVYIKKPSENVFIAKYVENNEGSKNITFTYSLKNAQRAVYQFLDYRNISHPKDIIIFEEKIKEPIKVNSINNTKFNDLTLLSNGKIISKLKSFDFNIQNLKSINEEYNKGKSIKFLSRKYDLYSGVIERIILRFEAGDFNDILEIWDKYQKEKNPYIFKNRSNKNKIFILKKGSYVNLPFKKVKTYHNSNKIEYDTKYHLKISPFELNKIYGDYYNGEDINLLIDNYDLSEPLFFRIINRYDIGDFNKILQNNEIDNLDLKDSSKDKDESVTNNDEINNLKNEITLLKLELKKQKVNYNINTSNLKNENLKVISEKENRIEKLTNQFKMLENTNKQIISVNKTSKKEIEKLNHDILIINENFDKQKSELIEENNININNLINSYKFRLNENSENLLENEKTIKKLNNQIQNLNNTIVLLHEENENVKNTFKEKEVEEYERKINKLQSYKEQFEKYSDDLNEIKQENINLKIANQNKTREIDQLKNFIIENKTYNENAKKSIITNFQNKMKEKNQQHEKELKELKLKADKAIYEENEYYNKELKELKNNSNNLLKAENSNLKIANQNKTREIDQLKKELKNNSNNLLHVQYSNLKIANQNKTREIDQLKKEIEELKNNTSKEPEIKESKKGDKSKFEVNHKINQKNQNQIKKLTREVDDLKNSKIMLNHKNKEYKAEINELNKEIEELKKSNNSINIENVSDKLKTSQQTVTEKINIGSKELKNKWNELNSNKEYSNNLNKKINCPNCGRLINKDSKFCIFCGKNFNPNDLTKPKVCPSCGSPIKEGSNFCGICGKKFNNK